MQDDKTTSVADKINKSTVTIELQDRILLDTYLGAYWECQVNFYRDIFGCGILFGQPKEHGYKARLALRVINLFCDPSEVNWNLVLREHGYYNYGSFNTTDQLVNIIQELQRLTTKESDSPEIRAAITKAKDPRFTSIIARRCEQIQDTSDYKSKQRDVRERLLLKA